MVKNKIKDEKFFAGGFFYSEEYDSVLLHLRDGNTKFNPNSWAFFGGLRENNETPIECFRREIKEELGIDIQHEDIYFLYDYLNKEFNTHRYVFFVNKYIPLENFNLMEGKDIKWIKLKDVFKYKLTDKTKKDLEYFIKNKGRILNKK